MNKTELVASVAERAGLTKKDSEKAVNAVLATVTESLQNGDKVQLVGFGTFEVRERKARKAKNPQTGHDIIIPETKVPAFKAGKGLKEVIAKKK